MLAVFELHHSTLLSGSISAVWYFGGSPGR